jgi:hypothetical protein
MTMVDDSFFFLLSFATGECYRYGVTVRSSRSNSGMATGNMAMDGWMDGWLKMMLDADLRMFVPRFLACSLLF